MKDISNNLVSIIIACFNEEKYINNCLTSLFNQSYKNIEIIVVDDGSTDRTKEIVKKHKCKLIKLDHQGTAIARNTGAKESKGDILVFLDADMEFDKDFISKLITPILEKKTIGTFSKLEYVKNWDKPLSRLWNYTNPNLPDKLRVSQDSNIGEDFRAILKSEFDKVKGFDDIGYTDTWTLGKKLNKRPINSEDAIYYHYNPGTFSEVFSSAKWIGKREYKAGKIGNIITIFRSLFIFSLVRGIVKMINKKEILAIPFYLVYDFAILLGALSSLFCQKKIK